MEQKHTIDTMSYEKVKVASYQYLESVNQLKVFSSLRRIKEESTIQRNATALSI